MFESPLPLYYLITLLPQRGQFIDKIIYSVHHQLNVIFLGHAVEPVFAKNNVYVVGKDPLGDLHGDVPGDVGVLEAVDETYGTGHRDGAVEYAVILRLLQKVHAQSIETFFIVLGRELPRALFFNLLLRLEDNRRCLNYHPTDKADVVIYFYMTVI